MTDEERKRMATMWIFMHLNSAKECIREGNMYVANMDIDYLRGMLQYMHSVGDINNENYARVQKVTGNLKMKCYR